MLRQLIAGVALTMIGGAALAQKAEPYWYQPPEIIELKPAVPDMSEEIKRHDRKKARKADKKMMKEAGHEFRGDLGLAYVYQDEETGADLRTSAYQLDLDLLYQNTSGLRLGIDYMSNYEFSRELNGVDVREVDDDDWIMSIGWKFDNNVFVEYGQLSGPLNNDVYRVGYEQGLTQARWDVEAEVYDLTGKGVLYGIGTQYTHFYNPFFGAYARGLLTSGSGDVYSQVGYEIGAGIELRWQP